MIPTRRQFVSQFAGAGTVVAGTIAAADPAMAADRAVAPATTTAPDAGARRPPPLTDAMDPLQTRAEAGCYNLAAWYDAFRAGRKAGKRINILAIGDSVTYGTDGWSPVDTLYRLFGDRCGFGGIGFVPLEPGSLATYTGRLMLRHSGWTFYGPTTREFDKSLWAVRAGATADRTSGVLSFGLKADAAGAPEYEFDSIRLHCISKGGASALRVRASDAAPIGSGRSGSGAWKTSVIADDGTVQTLSVAGFGRGTKRYVLEIAPRLDHDGIVEIGAVELLNSAGGVTVHRFAIGGYTVSHHVDQAEAAQLSYLKSFGCDAVIINLGLNDFKTPGADFARQYQILIDRIRKVDRDCPILIVRWFSTLVETKDTILRDLCARNDAVLINIKNIIPSHAWAIARNLQLTPAAYDPHLKRAGSVYVGHYYAKALSFDTVCCDLTAPT